MKIEITTTKCPHCGEQQFVPMKFNKDTLLMSVFNGKTLKEIKERNISLGGPGIIVYFKHCLNCGFIAPFNSTTIQEKKLL